MHVLVLACRSDEDMDVIVADPGQQSALTVGDGRVLGVFGFEEGVAVSKRAVCCLLCSEYMGGLQEEDLAKKGARPYVIRGTRSPRSVRGEIRRAGVEVLL